MDPENISSIIPQDYPSKLSSSKTFLLIAIGITIYVILKDPFDEVNCF